MRNVGAGGGGVNDAGYGGQGGLRLVSIYKNDEKKKFIFIPWQQSNAGNSVQMFVVQGFTSSW